MKTLKMCMAVLLIYLLAFQPVSDADAESAFTDTEGHWAEQTLYWAKQNDIASGFLDGSFKPNSLIGEAEFITLLYRTMGVKAETPPGASHWADGSYLFAAEMHYPLQGMQTIEDRNSPITRTYVAEMLAWADGEELSGTSAVEYILEQGYSKGKTSATVEGYFGADYLSRAEAIQFIKNTLDAGMNQLQPLPENTKVEPKDNEYGIGGISIGDSSSDLLEHWGPPSRKDASNYGFTWYVYNEHFSDFAMFGIQNGAVVALYTNALNWQGPGDIHAGTSRATIEALLGEPLDSILKQNTYYQLSHSSDEAGVYLIDGSFITFYYDIHENGKIMGIKIVKEQTEKAMSGFYGTSSTQVEAAYEKQLFDFANVERVKRNLPIFEWDDQAAATAKKHSKDMGVRSFFDHTNPDGVDPFERMENGGIDYMLAAENIAAGQVDAMQAHADWMNSKTGHRENVLGETAKLGTGVVFVEGSNYDVYYTQNFFTPMP
ncbi:CAP-associated domain-containing protein [Marinicrinis lubricantis]|uniref:CAP-associated domain-containing protein n=1 Tax=Marinicrinis lubricantis TaxID=2086470 RepID=A0ABW1IUX9_9BACL